MNSKIKAFLFGGNHQNSISQNIGFLLLRFFVGLALCTVFEKFFPKNGIWGPQDWFIQDTANMGFPFPTFFAWAAVISEFFGGILLMLGLFTQPAALLNILVTFTATFIYHKGDIGNAGLLSFFFMIMCLCILLFGPGKFSLDYYINKRMAKRMTTITTIVLLIFSFNFGEAKANRQSIPYQIEVLIADSSQIRFCLKNNSLFPKKRIFIIYQLQQGGNNTIVRWFLPFQKIQFDVPIGSKIYIAADSQVEKVMQGQRIDSDKPFLTEDDRINNITLQSQDSVKFKVLFLSS
ncbi:MAG TPA: DoxX family protein [Saprospiraceae bacterium]|nr:DoxX family protein [Saprospiraceae bacterium]HNT20529.1 DoxX family protein [Saprospiraceae bacterium]